MNSGGGAGGAVNGLVRQSTGLSNKSNAAPSCPRCGRGGDFLDPQRIAAMIAETPLAPSLAAGEELYKKRLEVCGGCEALREAVLCAHCGCFVLFRARPEKSYCPHPKGNLWADI